MVFVDINGFYYITANDTNDVYKVSIEGAGVAFLKTASDIFVLFDDITINHAIDDLKRIEGETLKSNILEIRYIRDNLISRISKEIGEELNVAVSTYFGYKSIESRVNTHILDDIILV